MKIVLPPSVERFLAAFAARRGRFLAFVLVVTGLSAGIAFLLPNWFRAESTLLPPAESGDSFGSLTGMIQSSALASLGLVSASSTSDVIVEVLKSRTLHESAIQKFHLDQIYRKRGMDRTLREFRRHFAVNADRSGVVLLSFEDRDPRRASEVTNYLTEELDRFNREIYSTRAKRTRQFLETRLEDTRQRLADAQLRLSVYEREHKVIAPMAQTQASVDGAASLMAQKMSLQIRRSYVSEYSDPSSQALKELDAQIAAMEREIGRLPSLKMDESRLALDVEVQSRLFTLISSQYEEARIQETRDTPTVTVLDPAKPPEVRTRPQRGVIVLMTLFAAVALCALYTVVELRTALES